MLPTRRPGNIVALHSRLAIFLGAVPRIVAVRQDSQKLGKFLGQVE